MELTRLERLSNFRVLSPYLICPEPDGGRVDHSRLLTGRHLGLRSRSGQERSPMPHNMIFGLSNYVSIAVIVLVVVVAVGIWWLRFRRK